MYIKRQPFNKQLPLSLCSPILGELLFTLALTKNNRLKFAGFAGLLSHRRMDSLHVP